MHETAQSISDWALATFGESSSDFRVATRANEEMAEALKEIAQGNAKKAAEECADVLIVLARLAVRMGLSLSWTTYGGLKPGVRCIDDAQAYAAAGNQKLAHVMYCLTLRHGYDGVRGEGNPLEQIADCMSITAGKLGYDIVAEVDRKMAINRERKWNVGPDGHGYHVKDDGPQHGITPRSHRLAEAA
ncbi:MAG TPA: hypothetical protein VKR31_04005 [Rhizomicrobium sp.]|nr:hypothetical protein [Rhizomicrobium sp.]